MQKSKQSQEFDGPDTVEPAPLKIVLVYDGFADLIRAHEIWAGLVARFKSEIEIVSSAWTFNVLRNPHFRRVAARHTADANMVVFSTSGRSELPEHMRNWFKAWMPRKKGRHDALVAVLDQQTPPTAATDHLRNYLRRTAEASGMDFFCNADQLQPQMEAVAGV